MAALAVIALPLVSPGTAAIAQPQADTASARAESLLAAKDYAGAASAFKVLTATHP